MKWILLAISGLLGLILAAELLLLRPQPPEIVIRPPASNGLNLASISPPLELGLGAQAEYQVLEQRPLFIEGRRPLAPPPPPARPPPPPPPPPPPKSPPPQLDLRGIVLINNERIALLGRPAERDGSTRLQQGDVLQGWTVTEVRSEEVVLQSGGDQTRIPLRRFSAVPLPSAPPAAAPGAAPPPPPPGRPQPAVRVPPGARPNRGPG